MCKSQLKPVEKPTTGNGEQNKVQQEKKQNREIN
jgi:hypothetical protein